MMEKPVISVGLGIQLTHFHLGVEDTALVEEDVDELEDILDCVELLTS